MYRNSFRYYQIGGVTIQVESELPITDQTFSPQINKFQVAKPGSDVIIYRHFFVTKNDTASRGHTVYQKVPWIIRKENDNWIYELHKKTDDYAGFSVTDWAIFNGNYELGNIYHSSKNFVVEGNNSLSTLVSDQIFLSHVFSDRAASYIHSAGAIYNDKGILFIGHSGAGKSTIVKMLYGEAEILCDDRVIVRKWGDGFRIHGTWSHGEIPDVSPKEFPLKALLFIEQSKTNLLIPLERKDVVRQLPFYVVKPLVTTDWWEKTLDLIEKLGLEVPAYRMQFDMSGRVKDILSGM